ncbi:VPGUxxT family thioredoxin-like (seleno)protein, type 2 [Gilvibacter sp.]|uniref:VPGUxxT family thioredoxin-like (seleno)protein, type 2 n=1 Tax=Gilvibacter sp. TaxID=2729997 RepID=UPI003F4A413D
MRKFFLVLLMSLGSLPYSFSQTRTEAFNQNVELGAISWYRDYDEALAASKAEHKPVLILFQEVPGCATCRNYGNNVLSHPLLTEAIENEFIPLAIFNNKGGKDAAVLKKYREPSWNNPVVRIVNENGENLVNRIAGNYTALGLYQGMQKALLKEQITPPAYMEILAEELQLRPDNTKQAVYSMYCFWSGEKALGSLAGVVKTEAGFSGGREVVKVTYNKDEISKDAIDAFAQRNSINPIIGNAKFRAALNDEDYYLQRSLYRYLPLSEVQRTKINSLIGQGIDPTYILSPSQERWLQLIKNKTIAKENRSENSFKTEFLDLKRVHSL